MVGGKGQRLIHNTIAAIINANVNASIATAWSTFRDGCPLQPAFYLSLCMCALSQWPVFWFHGCYFCPI